MQDCLRDQPPNPDLPAEGDLVFRNHQPQQDALKILQLGQPTLFLTATLLGWNSPEMTLFQRFYATILDACIG